MEEEHSKSVTLTLTESCNLACTYCYENHKSLRHMEYDKAIEILEYELNNDDGFNSVTVDFFGGEPFLEFKLMKRIVEYTKNHSFKKKFMFFVSTNGTLVHGEIRDWLIENKDLFWVGLSFDGTEYMQNINRSNSFNMVDLDFFVKTWPKQGIKMTISNETLPFLSEGVIFLQRMGFIVNCNLAYGLDWSNKDNISALTNELQKLIDYYKANPEIQPCSMLNMNIGSIAYHMDYTKWCGAGIQMRVYSPEGKLYPCHYFQPLAIGEELAEESTHLDFSNDRNLMDENCRNCPILSICPTCYGSNYASTGDVRKKDPNICKLTKIQAYANSYLWYNKLMTYSDQELKITPEERKSITDAIVTIQSLE